MSNAEMAIGADDPAADWQLKPKRHAAALPPEAGALKRALEQPAIVAIDERFEAADAAAVAAQARYKRIGHLGLYAAAAATLVGAMFLLPIDDWLNNQMRSAVSAIQIAALTIAFLASGWLARARPFDAWMKKRAEAEIARIALFDAVAQAQDPTRDGELPLLPLAFEYFRRYQLDVQRRYYRGRGGQHAAAVWRNNRWLTASFITTTASVVLGILALLHVAAAFGVPMPEWIVARSAAIAGPELNRVILAFGVAASAFYGLGVARSLMNLDERNASRYLTTAENLEYLASTKLQDARAAAGAGDREGALVFIAAVQNQISSEHQEWILLSAREDDPQKLIHGR